MATWCFSNRGFRVEEEGMRFLEQAVTGVFPITSSDEAPPAPR